VNEPELFRVRTQITRRALLGGAAGLFAAGSARSAFAAEAGEYAGFKLGIASYSLREFQRNAAIRMIRELNAPYVSVKEFHLPYLLPPGELAKAAAQFQKAGLTVTSSGNNAMQKDDDADIRSYFEYAKHAGIPMLVIAPTHTTLPKIERFVKEYNIAVAVHNHGPEDRHFPTPQSVLEAVKGMDRRVGLCMDLGHSARAGADLIGSIEQAGPRLLDMHIKDLKDFSAKAAQCGVGEGAIPVREIFKALKKVGYTGCVNLEYEIHADNPLPGMKQSLAYMRGVLAGLRG
jgi:sugar phosphate isomerase/epimerase